MKQLIFFKISSQVTGGPRTNQCPNRNGITCGTEQVLLFQSICTEN